MNTQQFIGKVFGHFRILEPAGQGGMGLVFKALNTHLDKIVALKMIAPGLSLNEKLLNRFKTEARALARLENPHIVRISDLLEANGQWFIVMEYVEGDTLRDRLKDKRPLPLKEAFSITEQILSALQHAHSASIVHRDIKPSNILLTKENLVKVTDFGLAKIQENSLIHTQVSAVGGTLYYMSPEQVRSLKETDHRTDIYSLGITMYQMVTGTVPFDPHKTDFDIRETIVRKPLPRPSTFNPYLPPEVDAFIMKAIEKNPDDRFQSAVEMLQALTELKEKLKDRLESETPPPIDTDDEINFDDYPFEIKDDFSEASLAPEIPVDRPAGDEKEASSNSENEQSPDNPSESTQLTRITEIVKNKRLWLISLLPVLIILLIIYLISLPSPSGPENTPPLKTLLSLRTQPAGAAVLLNGKTLGPTPIDSLPIQEGTIKLHIEKSGFLNFDSLMTVKKGEHLVLNIILAPRPTANTASTGQAIPATQTKPSTSAPAATPATKPVTFTKVQFNSTPSGADVFANNRYLGKTPFSEKLAAGQTVTLRFTKAGFREQTRTINVPAQENWQISEALKPLTAQVQVQANQWPVQVTINGKKKQTLNNATQKIALPAGTHHLVFQSDNFKPIEKTLHISSGQNQTVTLNFEPLLGTLEIHVLPWGNIYIDGTLKKSETNIKNRFTLTAGKHQIRIENPAFTAIEKTVHILPEKTVSLKYNFNDKIETRVLAFDTQNKPLFVQIVVDGTPTNQYTPAAVQLSPGWHQISVQKPGYQIRGGAQKVMILPEAPKTLRFVLEKE